ncbi:hypothetical protein Tco_1042489 [Tanacetum coccineum]|uniref:Uncharacterized protein n=1 Tax=Tanacetum coccineum TaxID=301880 RepID=A0ABQ5GKC7_9ASTR
MDKVYSWILAEETASKGRPVTFMENNVGENHKKGGLGKGQGERIKKGETDIAPIWNPTQIKEAVKSGKLSYLIKGIGKGKAKQTDTQLREWIAPTVKAEPATEGRAYPHDKGGQ